MLSSAHLTVGKTPMTHPGEKFYPEGVY